MLLPLYAGIGAIVLFLVYIWAFVFIHGGPPGKNKKVDAFVDVTCCPKRGLFVTLLSFGYLKLGFRRFVQFYRLVLFPQPQAKLGKPALDAIVHAVNSGEQKSLLKDYIQAMPKGMPLVLNFGSYT